MEEDEGQRLHNRLITGLGLYAESTHAWLHYHTGDSINSLPNHGNSANDYITKIGVIHLINADATSHRNQVEEFLEERYSLNKASVEDAMDPLRKIRMWNDDLMEIKTLYAYAQGFEHWAQGDAAWRAVNTIQIRDANPAPPWSPPQWSPPQWSR